LSRFCPSPTATERWTTARPDRACLTGILFVLRSGIPWQMLPKELDCGSGMTCWRRLRDWQQQGIWDLMHFALLRWLAREGEIDLVARHRGQLFSACGLWRNADRPEPDRSRQTRKQAASQL
jgi:transposase